MKINAIKIKLFGKTEAIYRVLDDAGEVLFVANSKQEAQAWIDSQG